MTAREFAYWLQGFFEIHEAGTQPTDNLCVGLTDARVKVIKKHLALVFAHDIDPSYPNGAELSAIHNPQDVSGGTTKLRC